MWGYGNRRKFGAYRCPKCNRQWMSAFAYEGYTQDCQRCKIKVTPHKLSPLEHPDGLDKSDQRIPHRQDLCGKCKSLGHSCC